MKQEIARPSIVRSRKTWLLCTVCALALGAGAGNPAYAGEGSGYPVTTNDPEIGVGAFGYTTLAVNPSNTSTTLSALIDEGGAGTVGAGTSVVTTANNFTASAGGNQVTNTISGTTLPLPNADLSGGGEGVVDGVAVLGNASNNATVATATVQGSAMVQSLAASVSAATVSSNTMAANVTLNQSTTTVQGQVPINYVADSGNYPESESASETFGNGDYIAVASVLATTVQMNTASGQLAGSAALVTGGNIGQTVTGADGTADVLNGSPAVIDNSLSANYVGNSATSGLTISAGGAPTFYGSAALTNLQQNSADSGEVETAAAHVTGSMIAFELQPGNPIIDEETETETPASIALTGALTITGNTISAIATGNQAGPTAGANPAGNILTLGGGIGLQGDTVDYTYAQFREDVPSNWVPGDVVLNNTQSNDAAPLTSQVGISAVLAEINGAVSGGSIALSDNSVTAQTVGNTAYNAVLAPGLGSPGTGAELSGTVALGNLQANQASPLTATVTNAAVSVGADAVNDGATLTAASNTISAAATGNYAENTSDLTSSDLASVTGGDAGAYGSRGPDSFGAWGDVMMNSLQSNDSASPVAAVVTGGEVSIATSSNGGSVVNSALSVTGNTTAALATGNASSNNLTLNGAAVTASAALTGGQGSYGAVSATLTAPLTEIDTTRGDDPSDSTLTLNGNLQRAIATGNNANNTLSVTGASIAVASEGGPASAVSYVPGQTFPFTIGNNEAGQYTEGGYVAYNDQATTAAVSATVTFPAPSMQITVGNDGLSGSTADNSANAVVAAARGNQGSTLLTLSPTASLSVATPEEGEAEYSPFAVVANAQTVSNGTNIVGSMSAGEVGEGEVPLPPIYTSVSGGGLTGSTLTMTANQVETLAEGNNATNGLTLSGAGTVAQPGGSQPLGLQIPPLSGEETPSTTLTADEAFVVQNMQFAGSGEVSAAQTATGVQAAITGNLSGSTVAIGGDTAALGNIVTSTATANVASNTLTLGASNLSASSGLMNFQSGNSAVSATTGTAGTLPTPGSSNTVVAQTTTSVNGAFQGNSQSAQGPTTQWYSGYLVSTDPNSTEDGFVQGEAGFTTDYYKQVSNFVFTQAGPVTNGEQTSFLNTIPPSAGTLGSPAFAIMLNGNVTNSVLGVTQNTVTATATANAATNTVASTSGISSSSLSFDYGDKPPTSGFTGPGADLDTEYGPSVLADVGLLNNQLMGGGGSSTAEANGTFAIGNTAAAPTYTNAALSLSNNTVQASAVGNTATNALTLSPGITASETPAETASLASLQVASSTAETTVSATSTMLVSAPMAMSGSTLSMSGNTNTASAVINDVTNTLGVSGAGSLPGTSSSQTASAMATMNRLGGPSVQAVGDYTVVNAQTVSGGAVESTASTAMLNSDLYLDPGAISGTSVAVDDNVTTAQAVANRADNALSITAAGPSGATGAIANGQMNAASVGASATIDSTLALGQLPSATHTSTSSNATYDESNNTTQALATGNQATNALNASPAEYGDPTFVAGSTLQRGMHTSATYAVLNAQINSGPVTAAVTGATPTLQVGIADVGGGYIAALNTTGSGNAVTMSGNTVTSQAIGNRAQNSIVLAAFNTGGATSSINSVQQNTGAISASISNVQVGAAIAGGTSARVGNNSLTASAFGNVATGSITTH